MICRRVLAAVALIFLHASFPSTCADESEEQEEAVHLDGNKDGLVAWPAKGVDGSWASSTSFSVELWWRPERKSRDDHEEQCIVSHGSWQGRFKLSTLPSRNLRFTVRDAKGGVVDCDGSAVLPPRRWMHVAVAWDSTSGTAKLLLNGAPDLDLRCNPPQPTHKLGQANGRGQASRPARPAPALPLLVGACGEGGGAVERSRGTLSALRLWPFARSESEVQADIFAWRLPPQASISSSGSSSSSMPGWSSLRRQPPRPHDGAEAEDRLQRGDSVAISGERGALVTASDLRVSMGTLAWSLQGSPRWVAAHCGDQVLSATLTVAELRGAGNALCSGSSHSNSGGMSVMGAPSWCALAPADRSTSRSLASALARRFSIMADEPESWLELHEARERLEGLGHVAAQAYAQAWGAASNEEKGVTFGTGNTATAAGKKTNTTARFMEHENRGENLVRIAIVAPSTSKGVPLPEWWDDLDETSSENARLDRTLRSLPLYGALLKSLYATCEPGYRYTVYVAANENDAILGNAKHVSRLFDLASEAFAEPRQIEIDKSSSTGTAGIKLGDFSDGQQCELVQYKLLSLPATIVPSRSLSALFNLPTLASVAAGEEYVYLANDDLLLVSDQWTSRFVGALQTSPLWPNLGVAGGVDTSDTVTPQLEFPFFHRTHVELFSWCGANPWAFKNWFEDNWLTDIYTPFVGAVHYLKDVEVANYGGLMRTAKSTGATDPRYDLGSGGSSGRTVPSYYVAEVAAGRGRIAAALRQWGVSETVLPSDLGYCAPPMSGALFPTLPQMPVGPHQAVLNPCHEKRSVSSGQSRPFERPARESRSAPPRAYFNTLQAFGASNSLPAPKATAVDRTKNAAGLEIVRNKDKITTLPESTSAKHEQRQLEIAVLHHHVPLFSRYGCDKRLTQVVSSLLALGHGVRYGGKHVSDFETDADKARLPAMGVSQVVTPLANGETVKPMVFKRFLTITSNRPEAKSSHSWGGSSSLANQNQGLHKHNHHQQQHDRVDVVFMTLWFWSTAPVPRDFLPLTRRFAPHAKIVLLSDDVHFHRASLLGNMPLRDVEKIRREELAFYRASDAVAVITSEDADRIRSAVATESDGSNLSVRVLPIVADVFADNMTTSSSESSSKSAALLPQDTPTSPHFGNVYEIDDDDENASFSSWAARAGVVMVGNGANPTNKASVDWFLKEVWPRARESLLHFHLYDAHGASQRGTSNAGGTLTTAEVASDGQAAVVSKTRTSTVQAERLATFTLIGADWDPALANITGVEVLGFLDDDALTAALMRARTFVSPIRSSTGLNTKNVLALEHGVPLVTTSLGAEGMGLPDVGQDHRNSGIIQAFSRADSADEFCTALVALYSDPRLWKNQRDAGRQHLRNYFSGEAQRSALIDLFRDIVVY